MITIDEAILRLDYIFGEGDSILDDKTDNAARLGSEALKQLKREREEHVGFWADRLPGETEK